MNTRLLLIKEIVDFCSEYMPYDMMDTTEEETIVGAQLAFTEHLMKMTVNELLSSVRAMIEDDLDADMAKLQEAFDNVIIEMILKESSAILGEESRVIVVRGTIDKDNWMIKIEHKDANFTNILIQRGDLIKTITHCMASIVKSLGEIKDVEQRASYWEVYCFLNLFEWRWKFIWS